MVCKILKHFNDHFKDDVFAGLHPQRQQIVSGRQGTKRGQLLPPPVRPGVPDRRHAERLRHRR